MPRGAASTAERVTAAEQDHQLIIDFRKEMEAAVSEAEKWQEYTETAGWQSKYHEQREKLKRWGRAICTDLERIREQIELTGPVVDTEKQLGDVKKNVVDLFDTIDAFHKLDIKPLKEAVERCGAVVERFRAAAKRLRDESPLHNPKIESQMDDAIAGFPKTTWDEQSGLVKVG